MGLYGSPDLSKKSQVVDKKENKLEKYLILAMVILNILFLLLIGIDKENIIVTFALDCIVVFVYSVGKLIYNIVDKNSIKNNILTMLVCVIMFLIFAVIISALQPDTFESNIKGEQIIKDKETYIALAETYSYKGLERNPDGYKGKIAVFKGKVIQVSESGFNNVVYRVNIADSQGEWADTIYVSYIRSEGEARILEDDIITIYGELNGVTTYQSVLGGNITIPSIKARYIIINE